MRKVVLLTLASLIVSTLQLPSAQAATKQAECIEFSNPRSTSNAQTITLQADLYSICATVPRDYDSPVYEMQGEESLFNLASCTGPMLKSASSLGRLYLGTLTCNLKINQVFGSTRVGATATSIKAWFAWDFSSKQISISHIAIPAKSAPPVVVPVPTYTPPVITKPSVAPTPTQVPIPTTSPTPIVNHQNCVSGDAFTKQCFDGDLWFYFLCSPTSSGELQEKINGKWKKISKFVGEKIAIYCVSKSTPYYVEVSDSSTEARNFRLFFYRTAKFKTSISPFNVVYK